MMNTLIMRFAIIILAVLIGQLGSKAQSLFPAGATDFNPPEIFCELGCEPCCDLNKIVNGMTVFEEFLENIREFEENARGCLEAGYDVETCENAATYCFTMNYIPWERLNFLGSFYGALELDQLFRINCGDGTCFQCCFSSGYCHTSFIGFPVINCNENYGADASAVGITKVLSGNPGDPCLFTPQTCEHISACNLHYSSAQIANINADPNHIMKSQGAKENRRRWFATKVGDVWLNFLNTYGNTDTTSTAVSDPDINRFMPHHIQDFLTGRGGINWRNNLENIPIDWTQTILAAQNDDSSSFAKVPSRLRAVYQAGVMRVLSSIPNFAERFDAVESIIWDSTAIVAYLENIPNPDQELLKYVHPITLTILKTLSSPPFKVLQDYRLLCVPLPGETNAIFDSYNGTELGIPPVVDVSKLINGSSVALSISISDLDDASKEIPVVVYWGDGRSDKVITSMDNPMFSISHDYKTAGKYQIYVIAENISGLQGITGVVANTLVSSNNIIQQGTLAINEIRLNNIEIKTKTTFGYPLDISFRLGGIDKNGRKYQFGKMTPITLNSILATPQSIGYVTGSVPLGINLSKLTVEFEISYKNGGDMWNNLSQNNSWWRAQEFSIRLWDAARSEYKDFNVPITAQMLTLLDIDNFNGDTIGSAYSYSTPITDPNGNLLIPFKYSTNAHKIKGVEISIPDSVIQNAMILPLNDPNWQGDEKKWKEIKPGYFVEASSVSQTNTVNGNTQFAIRHFPNPFKETTIIEVALKKQSQLSIDILDGTGRLIENLTSGNMESGVYHFPFRPQALSSGIYYYKVACDGQISVKPLFYMK